MNKKILNILVCPYCKSKLKLNYTNILGDDIIRGKLLCKKCSEKFPIINSIPRFINKTNNKKTKDSFNFEWNFYRYDKEQKEYYKKQIIDFLKEDKTFFRDKLVLEVGCGVGRQTQAIADYCKDLVILDISDNIKKVPKKNNIYPIQCDIMNIPLKENTFDFVYSRGVFHHTPNPKKTFENSVNLLKKRKGVLVFSVYLRRSKLFHAINSSLRFVSLKMDHKTLYCLCKFMAPTVPIFYKIMNPKKIRPISYWESVWLLFDWFSPQYQFHITEEELDRWCKSYNVLSKETGYRKIRSN